MIFTFYHALVTPFQHNNIKNMILNILQGYPVGNSLVEMDQVEMARELMAQAKVLQVELVLPSDVIIADAFAEHAAFKSISIKDGIPDGWLGLDIGPESIATFKKHVECSKTVLWNGPMGVFEWAAFAEGTMSMAATVADCTQKKGLTSIIGGGDSVAAVNKAGLADMMSHCSTGGGASLEMIQGEVLPGVAALTDDDDVFQASKI